MDYSIAERAERGAELLDRYFPGWALEIDTENFDMRYPTECVLGQVARKRVPQGTDWNDGLTKIGYRKWMKSTDEERREIRSYGFDGSWDDYEPLNEAWLAEIDRRVRETSDDFESASGIPTTPAALPLLKLTTTELGMLTDLTGSDIFRSITVELNGQLVTITKETP